MADSEEIIVCPACDNKMDKIFIQRLGRNIDICAKCGGIFFDNREFKLMDEKCESIEEIEEFLKDKELMKIRNEGTRICPSCGATMVKNNLGIKIDDCYTCGAKFLDGGELQEYRGEFNTENERSKAFSEFLDKAVRQKQQEEKDKLNNKKTL